MKKEINKLRKLINLKVKKILANSNDNLLNIKIAIEECDFCIEKYTNKLKNNNLSKIEKEKIEYILWCEKQEKKALEKEISSF